MKILWMQPAAAASNAGDAIYNRRIVADLEPRHAVRVVNVASRPGRVGRVVEAVWRAKPHDRQRLSVAEVVARHGQDLAWADVVVLSHEALDFLAGRLDRPVVVIAINCSSGIMRQTAPVGVKDLLGALYEAYERRLYADRPGFATVTLSEGDAAHLRRVGARPRIAWPGAPAPFREGPFTRIEPRLHISGSYDWWAKRRDVVSFAQEVRESALRDLVVAHEPLPAPVDWIRVEPDPERRFARAALEFGLVADRFAAGFKLKSGYYIANGMVVLTRCDLTPDYADLPHHDEFVVRISHPQEADAIMRRYVQEDGEGRLRRFDLFRRAALEKFTWAAAASVVEDAVRSAAA